MKLHDETIMPWGKFKGKPLADVPVSYIDWLRKSIIDKQESRRTTWERGFLEYCNTMTDALSIERSRLENLKKK